MFLLSLSKGVNVDFDLEFLLTAVRRYLCLQQEGGYFSDETNHPFISSLIQQCHISEFVFLVSDEEKEVINDTKVDFAEVMAGNPDAVRKLCLLALYKPIHRFMEFDQVARKLRYHKAIPKDLRGWIGERSKFRRRKMKLLERIEQLSPIADPTSRSVARQYEENPYPQWSTLTRPKDSSAKNNLKRFFLSREVDFIDRPFNVLIAGCGTGSQLVRWGLEFGTKADITALDLRKASLAYAAAKADQYGLDAIRFVHGDILALDGLYQVFDIVLVTGVIHHMADPLNGWRILVDRLRLGGLMLVSLYSAVVRSLYPRFGQHPDYRAAPAKEHHISKVRRELMAETPPGERREKGMTGRDFFYMSGVRDLMFHASEKRFTIAEIERCLTDLGLEFRGFDNLANPVYKEVMASFGDPSKLANWETYEKTNPRTFDGMYEIWCVKNPG
ncbi:MAG: methyltransferase domain-containing protein [Rhodospirillales bacterium]|nr:methyltransferase domain-containing protein [Rhodospirillales bacterium]